MKDTVFLAMANPIRRQVIDLLLEGPRSAGALAERFSAGRSTVSEHLGVLRDAGLVSERRRGRERIYALEAASFGELRAWLLPYERYWTDRLEALALDVEERE